MQKSTALDWLYHMILIREFEHAAAAKYQEGKIGGFLHLYIGQEAVAVGAITALNDDDPIVTHYRDHGHALVRGLDPNAVMAELFGRRDGLSRGKGGSMHLFDHTKEFWGGYAIVGGHIPLAAGIAWAIRYRDESKIVLNIFGDGATNIGAFHEGLNMAAVWNLPVLYLCENNHYGMGTAVTRASAVEEIHRKAEAYGIPHRRIDGMDVLGVHESFKEAADHVRGGNGPYFIEAETYRYPGHSMGDPERYRTKEEKEKWQKKDPIERFARKMKRDNVLSDKDIEKVQAKAERVVDGALRFAEESPEPDEEVIYEDIYSMPIEPGVGPVEYGRDGRTAIDEVRRDARRVGATEAQLEEA